MKLILLILLDLISSQSSLVKLDRRIVNGDLSKKPYSFYGSLRMKNKTPDCGATIIAPNIAITAGHCLTAKNHHHILFNTINSKEDGTQYKVKNTIIYEAYDGTFGNDIGLLILDKEYKQNTKVVLSDENTKFENKKLKTIGFGKNSFNGPTDNKLHEFELKFEVDQKCKSYNKNSHYCLAPIDGISSTCSGDSGSPLFIEDKEKNSIILTGLTSYGKICDAKGGLFFTKIPTYKDWIENVEEILKLPEYKKNYEKLNESILNQFYYRYLLKNQYFGKGLPFDIGLVQLFNLYDTRYNKTNDIITKFNKKKQKILKNMDFLISIKQDFSSLSQTKSEINNLVMPLAPSIQDVEVILQNIVELENLSENIDMSSINQKMDDLVEQNKQLKKLINENKKLSSSLSSEDLDKLNKYYSEIETRIKKLKVKDLLFNQKYELLDEEINDLTKIIKLATFDTENENLESLLDSFYKKLETYKQYLQLNDLEIKLSDFNYQPMFSHSPKFNFNEILESKIKKINQDFNNLLSQLASANCSNQITKLDQLIQSTSKLINTEISTLDLISNTSTNLVNKYKSIQSIKLDIDTFLNSIKKNVKYFQIPLNLIQEYQNILKKLEEFNIQNIDLSNIYLILNLRNEFFQQILSDLNQFYSKIILSYQKFIEKDIKLVLEHPFFKPNYRHYIKYNQFIMDANIIRPYLNFMLNFTIKNDLNRFNKMDNEYFYTQLSSVLGQIELTNSLTNYIIKQSKNLFIIKLNYSQIKSNINHFITLSKSIKNKSNLFSNFNTSFLEEDQFDSDYYESLLTDLDDIKSETPNLLSVLNLDYNDFTTQNRLIGSKNKYWKLIDSLSSYFPSNFNDPEGELVEVKEELKETESLLDSKSQLWNKIESIFKSIFSN